MSVSIQVPDELYQQAVEIGKLQKITADDVFASALAQQIAEWERLKRRGARGSRERFLEILKKTPSVEPPDYDRI
jgi:hypothetical protein